MPRRIEHRARYRRPASEVYQTLLDADYLRARLTKLGGSQAELIEHADDGELARIHMRHGIEARHLPSAVRAALGGDLVIDRIEQWRGPMRGTAKVTVPRTPAELTANLRLVDVEDGCEHSMEGSVSVSIPLVGGKVEDTIVRQVRDLLDAEREFTEQWLDDA